MVQSRPRSGNPGYLMSAPVLFGTPNASKYIFEEVGGLQIPVAVGSASTTYSPGANNQATSVYPYSGKNTCPQQMDVVGGDPIRFGYDVKTGCILNLNRFVKISMERERETMKE